jgi:hypothetical protein
MKKEIDLLEVIDNLETEELGEFLLLMLETAIKTNEKNLQLERKLKGFDKLEKEE